MDKREPRFTGGYAVLHVFAQVCWWVAGTALVVMLLWGVG